MLPSIARPPQDVAGAEVARDALGQAAAWTPIVLAASFVAIFAVLLVMWIEMRRAARAWDGFLAAFGERSLPLAEHASAAARNVERVTRLVRAEVERLARATEGVSADVQELSDDVRRRLADVSALLDVAQEEAEDAVLDTAAKVRALRSGASALLRRGALETAQRALAAARAKPTAAEEADREPRAESA